MDEFQDFLGFQIVEIGPVNAVYMTVDSAELLQQMYVPDHSNFQSVVQNVAKRMFVNCCLTATVYRATF